MQKKVALIILFLFFINIFAIPVYAQSPQINSPSVILIDSATGRILYEKNSHEKMYPASITKIMTAILALEKGNLNDIVTASSEAVLSVDAGGSNVGILPGEELSLENLLYALMVSSANESANVIAEHIAGSIDEFVKLMNQRAAELGAKDTYFVNTNGLHDDRHVTTAYDMALISRHAMTIPKFREIANTSYYEIQPTNKYNEKRYLSNTNHLINKYRATRYYNYLYEPAIGIKTGYTSKANHTLVAAAKKNGLELITVVMGSKLDGMKYQSYEDTINLFEYGFNNFGMQTIVKPGDIIDEVKVMDAKANEHVILLAEQALTALLPNNVDKNTIQKEVYPLSNIKAPINKGDVLGFATYKYQDQVLGKVNLVADRNVEQEPIVIVKNKTISILNSLWFRVLTGVIGSVLVILVILRIARRKKKYSFSRNKVRYIRNKKW
ncbi:MAG: hypothetical protein PWR27_1457 [Petroclostridium sp.]|jgi:D-alanyl-D-alanine carboxypeptidase|nr:hypothetical protein [Petroclostridium sp.]